MKQIIEFAWNSVKTFVPNLMSSVLTALSSLGNFVIGFIVCLYILIDKDKIINNLGKFGKAVLNKEQYKKACKIALLAFEKFSNFFSGKIYDSIIIGILCFIAMLFINKEYATLIAVIVGITNIIPFFGPIIGAVPCALLLLIVDPFECLIFVIMIIILQQLDGNVIGPAILGDSVGLSSLWIMFAILVGGAYFGFFGMLLGVPVVAVIYYIVKEFVDEKLKNI
jgi:predicted PurR-regulated permease PerM